MRVLLGLWVFLLAALPVAAQQDAPVALFADSIRYDTGTRTIVAEGNVEAFYQEARLSADRIRYNTATERLQAQGQIRLEGPSGVVILADLAELSADFREGLITGARLILDQQFQVAAVEAGRTQGKFNTLYRTVASSCSVCEDAPRPIWRIRATNVTHDEEARRLYFRNAWVDIFGIPVLYVPRLRVPEPGVERAGGFLVPSFATSDVFGFAARVPYFQPLGDHADITLTPFVATSGAIIVENEYRQRFAAGELLADGAIALNDGLDAQKIRGFGTLTGSFDLGGDYVLDLGLAGVTDRSFLGQFDFSDEDRLTSTISVNRTGNNSYLDIRAEAYQTLRDDEDQGAIPFALPNVSYRKLWNRAGGTLALDAGLLTLLRTDGLDVVRGEAGMDWTGTRTMAYGVQATGLARFDGQLYSVYDDADFGGNVLVRTTPTVGAELRWPWARVTRNATHVIQPITQVLYSDILGDEEVPNEDSLLPEFDENNLFSLSRFPGSDAQETGFRLNTGVSYTRYDPSGWNLSGTLGRVFRTTPVPDFSVGSGLSGESSDYVVATTLGLADRFTATGRGLFDSDLEFTRAEYEMLYTAEGFDFGTSYTFLSEDDSNPDLGLIPERQEVALNSRYRITPHWELTGEWRYDIAESESIFVGGGITFGNECIVAALSLGRVLTDVNSVPPRTKVSFEVSLTGIGADKSEGWPGGVCRGI